MANLIAPFAAEKPDDIALVDDFGETTWADFNNRVNQLIHSMRNAGLKTGDALAVVSGNRREYVEAFTALAPGGRGSRLHSC
jgi:long-chain acyl-CoA synthetase